MLLKISNIILRVLEPAFCAYIGAKICLAFFNGRINIFTGEINFIDKQMVVITSAAMFLLILSLLIVARTSEEKEHLG